MYTMFKRPNNQNAKNETDLLSLVGDYDKFKGWDEVHQRVLSHANEVSIKSPAGWYPLEHAFYHHPDYPRKPMPLAVVQSFIAADPKSAKWSVVEACSNPFTLNESLEVLLHAVDAQYFDLQAERDFHRICKNDNPSTVDEKARCTFAMNTEMKTTYVQIAAKKGLRWDRGLKSMLKDTLTLFSISSLKEILSDAIKFNRKWNDGLEDILKCTYCLLDNDMKIGILHQAAAEEWVCDKGFYELLNASEELMHDDEVKRYFLQLSIANKIVWRPFFRELLSSSHVLLEEEDGRVLLKRLFYYAIASDKEGSLNLLFYLLREFQSLHDFSAL